MSEVGKYALDLTKECPRSPREKLAGFVIAARTLDKCRAKLNNSLGDYKFDCPLDNRFFHFTNITAAEFESLVSSGVNDDQVVEWIQQKTSHLDSREIIAWNNQLRYTRICDMPIELQEFLEDYIPQFIPKNRVVNYWFDVYDIEEGRI